MQVKILIIHFHENISELLSQTKRKEKENGEIFKQLSRLLTKQGSILWIILQEKHYF